jgi:hypothetical protein
LYEESLTLAQEVAATPLIAACLDGFATLAASDGRPERAARLFGAAEALRTTGDEPSDRAQYESHVAAVRAALGEERFAASWAAGRALPTEEAIAEALAG